MKRKLFTTALLMGCVLFCLAAIAELTGKWNGSINMGGNEIALTYIFKVDGEKLTGSIISPQGELPMFDGKIKGDDFSFKIDVNGTTIENVGRYYGDSVVVNANMSGQPLHSKLLRAK